MKFGKSDSQVKPISLAVSLALACLVPAVSSAAQPSIKDRLAQVRAVVASGESAANFDGSAVDPPPSFRNKA